MKFDEFNLGGVSTGINIISPYLDHQTPYGYWEWLSDGSFMFDFSGDLGWTNALFGPENMALAVESLTGNMFLPTESAAENSFLAANDQWLGTGDLSGAKFTFEVTEPSSIFLLLIGSLFILVFRHSSTHDRR